MDTTTVATAAIAAMAGLGGGLGGAMIAARHQQSAERSRQRERAAEVFGAMGPEANGTRRSQWPMPCGRRFVRNLCQTHLAAALGGQGQGGDSPR